MKLFSVVILLSLQFLAVNTFAQNKAVNNKTIGFISESIVKSISDNLKPNPDSLSHTCRNGCIFIKIQMDETGNLKAAFTKNNPSFIIDALKTVMDSLRQNNTLILTIKQLNKTIIQPFFYSYQLGCEVPKTGDGKSSEHFYQSHYNMIIDMEHYSDLLYTMFNFTDGKVDFLDCIVLPPDGVGEAGY